MLDFCLVQSSLGKETLNIVQFEGLTTESAQHFVELVEVKMYLLE